MEWAERLGRRSMELQSDGVNNAIDQCPSGCRGTCCSSMFPFIRMISRGRSDEEPYPHRPLRLRNQIPSGRKLNPQFSIDNCIGSLLELSYELHALSRCREIVGRDVRKNTYSFAVIMYTMFLYQQTHPHMSPISPRRVTSILGWNIANWAFLHSLHGSLRKQNIPHKPHIHDLQSVKRTEQRHNHARMLPFKLFKSKVQTIELRVEVHIFGMTLHCPYPNQKATASL